MGLTAPTATTNTAVRTQVISAPARQSPNRLVVQVGCPLQARPLKGVLPITGIPGTR